MKGTKKSNSSDESYRDVPLDLAGDDIFLNVCPSVEAVYHSSSLELQEHGENPLILALPPFGPMKPILNGMAAAFNVPHAQLYRNWPIDRKILAISRISQVLVLQAELVELLSWLHTAIRHRYSGLVPTRSLRKRAQENYALVQAGSPRPICLPGDSHALSRFVFGISGAGKTTLAKMVLSTFPMIVEHREYEGVPARFVQVVWAFVSCPANGSVLTLMKGILHWFDLYLGTYYVEEISSRSNTTDYILKVEDVLRRHFVGVLVIDEIQFALKAADKTQLIDFLTNLLNSNNCTFILLGTPEAREYMVRSFRTTRRSSGDGAIEMGPFSMGKLWKRLASAIISIDFLPIPPSDSEEIMKVLHEVSAGLPAFAKMAWKLTQYRGVQAGSRSVTPALVREAVEAGFGPVENLLQALRTRDYVTLAKCVDLATADVEAFRERVAREKRRLQIGTKLVDDAFLESFSAAVAVLIEMGRSEIEAESLVRRILETDRTLSFEDVIRRALSPVDASQSVPIKRKGRPRVISRKV
ncbi:MULTISPECIES: ATP-binding protein [unclassified Burkholderia]|uniref:ATP-binding protein n=1 Tax=unclassified Burkholderia TaxID=2613784 RepID=UPI00198192DA|nr:MULTISPECIES: ATP-binding protein [unclassified Burkholderia]MBN3769282.1 ATP-binding protein [Burkholderia sp. Se-20378]MBN3793994.1 ATP-binding protein [Burkholderia sp. Ac-20392]